MIVLVHAALPALAEDYVVRDAKAVGLKPSSGPGGDLVRRDAEGRRIGTVEDDVGKQVLRIGKVAVLGLSSKAAGATGSSATVRVVVAIQSNRVSAVSKSSGISKAGGLEPSRNGDRKVVGSFAHR